MEDTTSKLLAHYGLETLYPSEWPADRDHESDASDPESTKTAKEKRAQRTKSRYAVLERGSGRRVSVAGAEKGADGVENLVQRDEADPLGTSTSVVQVLRSRGLPVEEDMKFRNRFLLSSTTFSPSLFLSQVHSSASTDSLLDGLDFLSRSIEKKSASLKVLVESNFERFVRAKTTIDNVYTEMRNQGAEEESHMLSTSNTGRERTHSRQWSRGSGHYRKLSIAGGRPGTPNTNAAKDVLIKPPPSDKRKNALTKESEYGVSGIRAPLVEVAVKAEEVWGPALGGREREETLKAVISTIEKHRELFELGTTLQDAIRRKDNRQIIEEFMKARRFAEDAREIANSALQNHTALTDQQIYQILVTARVWTDVETQVKRLKSNLWSRLAGIHFTKQAANEEGKREEHMELITVLLELGVDDNPFEAWLISRYYYLKHRIQNAADRAKIEIEILRRRIDQAEKPTIKQMSIYLRAPAEHRGALLPASLDNPKVIEFWEHLLVSVNALLSLKGGLLGEVMEFWETAQSIISGAASANLPAGPNGQSKQHHQLTADAVRVVYEGAAELETLLRESVSNLFLEPPPTDISLLMSPVIPNTPDTPRTPKTPKSALLSPFMDSRFKFDPADIPPPSPSRGEAWEGYAFWPPYANCLSGVHYLSKVLVVIGIANAELANMKIPQQGNSRPTDESRRTVNRIRERCAFAVCAAWDKDADHAVRAFEDWTRSPEKREITNLPSRFLAFENYVLSGTQKILYIEEAGAKAGNMVTQPSSSLVQLVRNQFNVSLYKLISGIDELVKKGEESVEIGDVTIPARRDDDGGIMNSIDARTESVRLLLALSNLSHIRSVVIIQLRQTMESQLSITLADDIKKLNADLSTLDAQLFEQYITPHSNFLQELINQGIKAPDWEPPTARPSDARPYVYSVLLRCVLIHTELLTYTPPLTVPILRHLLERISNFLITAFETRPRFSLPALMQATLDTEFLAQTLNQYTTDKASEIQSKIYVVLDDRTGQTERVKLQEELQEMRSVLKRLRDATRGEFSCFKRARGPNRPGSRGRE